MIRVERDNLAVRISADSGLLHWFTVVVTLNTALELADKIYQACGLPERSDPETLVDE